MTIDKVPYRLVIHTNKDKNETIEDLKQLGVLQYFEQIYTLADLGLFAKPSTKNYQILTEKIRVDLELQDNSQIGMVDCRLDNLQVAASISCKTVYIPIDRQKVSIKQIEKCDATFDNFKEMYGLSSLSCFTPTVSSKFGMSNLVEMCNYKSLVETQREVLETMAAAHDDLNKKNEYEMKEQQLNDDSQQTEATYKCVQRPDLTQYESFDLTAKPMKVPLP